MTMKEYEVELGVNGTWRESVAEESEEEAVEVIKQNLEEHLGIEEGEWGDLAFSTIGVREVEPRE